MGGEGGRGEGEWGGGGRGVGVGVRTLCFPFTNSQATRVTLSQKLFLRKLFKYFPIL